MNVYNDIHCLKDFGMIAGGYKVIYIDCTDNDNIPIDLTSVSAFGCRFFHYGTNEVAFTIGGVISEEYSYRMKIEISSSVTADFQGCCLEYMPYVTVGGNTIKYGKGRLVIEEG